MSEGMYISKCLRLIEQKVNRGSSKDWTSENYKRLQKLILEASGITLSTHTLERLYGKLKTHKEYKPQAETKNALARFLGYADWDTFKIENPIGAEEPEDALKQQSSSEISLSPEANRKRKKIIYLIVIGMAIGTAAGWMVLNRKSSTATSNTPIKFSAVNPFGTVPHTAKFLYDLSKLEGNNFSIFFPKNGDTVQLVKTQTFTYKPFIWPGHHVAYLLSDKKTMAQADVYIQTPGWTGNYFVRHPDDAGRKTEIPADLLRSAGRLYTPYSFFSDSIKKADRYFISYVNIRDYKVDGDNASFETRFRNAARGRNAICNDMWFKLMGTKGILKMHFLMTGCFAYVDMTFGDKNLKGTEQDFSPFSTDIHSWKKARLEVVDKNVRIYLDNSLLYETKYSMSVGNIVGIEVLSKTSGETDYVKLYNAKKELVYEDDFGGKPFD
jgi:hypothetical protein